MGTVRGEGPRRRRSPARERGQGRGQDYAAEAKDYAQGVAQQTKEYVAEQTKEYVEGAREYLGDAVQQARDKVAEYRDGGMDKVRHDVLVYTREQPMTALFIAAGAGLVAGLAQRGEPSLRGRELRP